VHVDDPEYAHYADIAQLPPHRLRELERFFLDYKVLEEKTVEVGRFRGRAEAERVIRDAVTALRAFVPRPEAREGQSENIQGPDLRPAAARVTLDVTAGCHSGRNIWQEAPVRRARPRVKRPIWVLGSGAHGGRGGLSSTR